jgi:hypothetical protein
LCNSVIVKGNDVKLPHRHRMMLMDVGIEINNVVRGRRGGRMGRQFVCLPSQEACCAVPREGAASQR